MAVPMAPKSSPISSLSFNEWISYLTWAIAGLMFAAAWFLLRGNAGRAFRAVMGATPGQYRQSFLRK